MAAVDTGALELPENEFSYIGRPWTTFIGRWAAIRAVLVEEQSRDTGKVTSILDLGSNNGYFSLQSANLLPHATVIGVEGAVGVGNGSTGTATTNWTALCGTSAIRTHFRWIRKLGQKNCVIAPEVWDYQRIKELVKGGLIVDVMLSLSVVHHIDNYAADKSGIPEGPARVPYTMTMLSDLLKLARVHIIELPDKPWISHVHDAFNNNPRAILEAVCKEAGGDWEMRKIYENAWIGHRELWLVRRTEPQPPFPIGGAEVDFAPWREFFPILIPSKDPAFLKWFADHAKSIDESPRNLIVKEAGRSDRCVDEFIADNEKLELKGTEACLEEVLFGQWQNQSGERIILRKGPGSIDSNDKSQPSCWAQYTGRGLHPIYWRQHGGSSLRGVSKESDWVLSNHGGEFRLKDASKGKLVWARGGVNPFTTTWHRVDEPERASIGVR